MIGWVLIFCVVAIVALAAYSSVTGNGTKPAAKRRAPVPNAAMICPHCQVKGEVSTRQVKVKIGVSGGKATGAVLTGGLSVLATGLSRKAVVTQAHCGNCGSGWTF